MADKVIISKSKLVALGDVIREKTGSSEKMTVDTMTETMRNHSGGSDAFSVFNIPYNNPNLPNLYYFMMLKNKNTLCIDFNKMVDYEIEHDIFKLHGYAEKDLSDTFTSDTEFNTATCIFIPIFMLSDVSSNYGWSCSIGFSNGNVAFYDFGVTWEFHIIGSYQAEDTMENVLRSLGEQCFELANILPNSIYEYKNELLIMAICGPVFDGETTYRDYATNLNDYPIEHMWFE